jgi:2-(1,2-epoxy-1,2-dihydrophenyl)acetyl-CoA isomerase
MTDYKTIIVEKRDSLATITLNRPDKLNAMTVAMVGEIEEALRDLGQDENTRALIITGAGRGFCSGADLGSGDLNVDSPAAGLEMMRQASRVILGIRELPKPVIAAVNGPAVGGGCSLALACDIIIAGERAVFGAPFVLRNLHPDFGATYFLPRLVGTAKASDLLLTGRIVDATEADRMGLVSRVVPQDRLEKTVEEIANALAAGAPVAIKLTKASINKALNIDLPTMLELEARAQCILTVMEDCQEAKAAFLEKRPPRFKGR